MIKDVANVGLSFVHLGDHILHTTLLNKPYSKGILMMEGMRHTWMRRHSIVMDSWTDISHQLVINIIVKYIVGSYFHIHCSFKETQGYKLSIWHFERGHRRMGFQMLFK